MARLLRQSTSVDVPIGPFLDSTDGITAESALTLTQPDIRLKKNGGAWAQKAAAQTLSHEENGYYEVTLDATDTNTLGLLRLSVAEAGAIPIWEDFHVVTANVWDTLFSTDNLDVSVIQWLGSAVATPGTAGVPSVDTLRVGGTVQTARDLGQGIPNAVPGAAGGLFIAGTNAATTITTGLTTTFTGNLTGSVGSVTGAVGSVTGAVGSVTGAVGSVTGNVGGNVTGTVGTVNAIAANAITAAATAVDFGTEVANAVWSLDATGQQTQGTFGQAVGDPGATAKSIWGVANALPDSGALTTLQADTDNIQTRIPAALVSGRMDCSVGAMAADVVTAAATATDFGTEVANAVWSLDATGQQTQGTFGQAVGDPTTGTSILARLPNATAGAAGGVFIAGTNAATTVTTSFTTTFTGNLTGSVGSVTGAVGSVTGAVGSVTGNVGGNVTGSVGSVTGLTASNLDATVSSRLASVSYTAPPTTTDNAVAVWSEALPGTYTSGQAGYKLNAAGAAGDPWSTAIPGAYGAGTAGHRLGNVPDVTAGATGGLLIAGTNAATTITGSLTTTFTGDLTGSVGTVNAIATNAVTAASIASDAGAEIADAVWDEALAGHAGAGTTGAGLTSASSAGDPWGTLIPGAYGAGTAGNILGNNVNATISSRATATNVSDVQTAVLAKLPSALVSGRIDASVGAMANDVVTPASLASGTTTEIQALVSGTVDSATTTTITDADRTEGSDNYWKGNMIVFTSGSTAGQCRLIQGFTFANDTLTFTPATVGTTDAGATYEIRPAAGVDVRQVAGSNTSTSSALIGVNVVNAAGTAWGSGAITSGSIAAGAIGATQAPNLDAAVTSRLAPTVASRTLDVSTTGEAGVDWANVGSPTTTVGLSGTTVGTTSAVTGLTASNLDATVSSRLAPTVAARTLDVSATGEAGVDWANVGSPTTSQTLSSTTIGTATAVTTVNGIAANVVNASALATDAVNEIAAAVGALAGADPSGVPAASASLAAKIDWLCALARNKRTTTATTETLRNDADSGSIGTAGVSDDGSLFTRTEWS